MLHNLTQKKIVNETFDRCLFLRNGKSYEHIFYRDTVTRIAMGDIFFAYVVVTCLITYLFT